jgi:hypothetical protein
LLGIEIARTKIKSLDKRCINCSLFVGAGEK